MPTMPTARRQDGFVLITGLLVLLVMTILGLSAMRGTTLQTAMAGNMQDRAIALQAAEAALRAGEARLSDAGMPVFGSTTGFYIVNSTDDREQPRWQAFYGPLGGADDHDVIAFQGLAEGRASYFVEKLQDVVLPGNSLGNGPGVMPHVYRVTAQGVGRDPDTVVVLQSTFIR